jgi:hypothetical protein
MTRGSNDLYRLLEEWSVLSSGQWVNDQGPRGWWAVCNDKGIVAYFGDETDAFRFRLSEINRALNR